MADIDICKQHNKPKDQVWKERQARGGALNRIGCVDCKAEARNAPPRASKRPISSFSRRRL
jgi:hypothetical protein